MFMNFGWLENFDDAIPFFQVHTLTGGKYFNGLIIGGISKLDNIINYDLFISSMKSLFISYLINLSTTEISL